MEIIRMPMAGRIASIRVREGQQVSAGDTVGIFESMKMQMPLVAPAAGVVSRVLVTEGAFADQDAPLFEIT
ncbi:MAG: acetyl-CoA carboxylase biotin carboxyl carrier protein subunit [Deltaproteobacteria bacterium]|nr:acetyl-CoA carboxylase biotin carboxyl carrier protein subunit [Deltaproteobacteria bacterium]